MQVYNSFQDMEVSTGAGAQGNLRVFNPEQVDACAIANAPLDVTVGGTPPVTPAQQTPEREAMPPWGKRLDERVGALEMQMRNVVQGVARIEAKLDKR